MAFTLASPSSGSAVPFCLGFAFRKGDIPSSSGVVGNIANIQVVAKNRWNDGSLKFAVVSGRAALTANQALTVTLSAGTAASGTALALSDLKATGVTASVGCGSYGSVSWSGTAWDSPFSTWITGPEMSSWIYRAKVGSDSHLVAWLEVRLWKSGDVEVLPWIENGYMFVAGPTNKNATFTFTLGGTQRFSAAINLPHHCRTPLISGTALSYWLGTDPRVTPGHDKAYFQATEMVPTFRGSVAANSSFVSGLVTSYTPLQQGNFTYQDDYMPGAGYQEPIGLLPQHDVLYLVTPAAALAATYGGIIRNGFSAGRYAIHYRDESTNRPPKFSSYPTLVLWDDESYAGTGASTTSTYTAQTSGTAPPTWDASHQPSVGYMAYLVTGRWYFMEEVQFAATANYMAITDWLRGGGDNGANRSGYTGSSFICWSGQTRAGAWNFRSLIQALAITPDSDTALQPEFKSAVEDNCRYYSQIYLEQPNNAYGWVYPAEDYTDDGVYALSPWQQDFGTGAWGWAIAMGLPISSTAQTKMSNFFAWRAKSVIGRLGTKTDYWYINGNPYTLKCSSTANAPDFLGGTGPWPASWNAIYNATFDSTPPPNMSTTEGVLAVESSGDAAAMWGNLQPAIAYAVRFGVSGALAGYNRMIGASNWSTLNAGFSDSAPQWGVMPALIP